jgi:hypothetical protein
MAQQQDLEIQQGSDYYQVFKFFEDEAKTIPLDLTGSTAMMYIRRDDYDGAKLVTLESELDGGLSINEAASTISVSIPAAVTSAILAVKGDDSIPGVYDLEIYGVGTAIRVVQGAVIISREVTRP